MMSVSVPVFTRNVGVLGGAGPFAGARTVTEIMRAAAAAGARTDDEFPTVVCHSNPNLGIGADGATDWSTAGALEDAVSALIASGAGIVGIACNSAHRALNSRRQPSVVDLPAAIAAACATTGATRAGLLAASATLRSGMHANALEASGIEVVTPDASHQAAVDAAIIEATWAGRCPDLTAVAATLEQVDCVVLGCTELDASAVRGRRCIDSVEVLAATLVAGATR